MGNGGLVRAGAFVRAELVATLRQPRLLLVLVLGPFLILFLFGLGYERTIPELSTVVVGQEAGGLTERVDAFIREEEPAGIDYRGTTRNEAAAIEALREGRIDLVVVLPDRPLESLARNERAIIEIHQRSLDPITSSQISIVAATAVDRINDDILEQLLQRARDEVTSRLRSLARSFGVRSEAVEQLERLEPEIVVRPFDAQVISQTPVQITLDRFYAPGLVALMLQHLGVTFAALALVRERASGVTEMMSVSPTTTAEGLIGRTFAFLLLGGVTTAALAALIVAVFGVPLPASWVGFVGLMLVTLLASIGLGFLAASVASTDSQAVQLAMLLLLAAIFFSGLFMPLERIGLPAEIVSWLLPATYAFEGLQHLMLLGRPVPWWLLIGPAVVAAAAFAVAGQLLRRRDPLG